MDRGRCIRAGGRGHKQQAGWSEKVSVCASKSQDQISGEFTHDSILGTGLSHGNITVGVVLVRLLAGTAVRDARLGRNALGLDAFTLLAPLLV